MRTWLVDDAAAASCARSDFFRHGSLRNCCVLDTREQQGSNRSREQQRQCDRDEHLEPQHCRKTLRVGLSSSVTKKRRGHAKREIATRSRPPVKCDGDEHFEPQHGRKTLRVGLSSSVTKKRRGHAKREITARSRPPVKCVLLNIYAPDNSPTTIFTRCNAPTRPEQSVGQRSELALETDESRSQHTHADLGFNTSIMSVMTNQLD